MQMRADLGHFIIIERLAGAALDARREAVRGAERAVPQRGARRSKPRSRSASALARLAAPPESERAGEGPDHQPGGEHRPEIGPQRVHALVPRELAPADVAAVEAVGEIDLVDRAIGARPGVGEAVGDRGHGEDPAALGDERCRR